MVGLLFQIILFSIASAQDFPGRCKSLSKCEPCEYVSTGPYNGTWTLVNKFSYKCWNGEGYYGCLYKKGTGDEACFCDPGQYVYEPCSGGCYTARTPEFKVTVANDFQHFDVDCSQYPKHALSQFQLTNPSGDSETFQYNYTCCPFNPLFHEDQNTESTPFYSEANSAFGISLQNVTCKPETNTFIERFQQVSTKGVYTMHYALRCGFMSNNPVCIKKQTAPTTAIGYLFPDLQHQDVKCPTDYQFLFQFKLEEEAFTFSYHYTCCHQG